MKKHVVVFLLLLFASVPVNAQSESPNVVIILADDLGYADVEAYDAPKIETPNIDNLAGDELPEDRVIDGKDIAEQRNLALDHPEIVKKLKKQLKNMRKKLRKIPVHWVSLMSKNLWYQSFLIR